MFLHKSLQVIIAKLFFWLIRELRSQKWPQIPAAQEVTPAELLMDNLEPLQPRIVRAFLLRFLHLSCQDIADHVLDRLLRLDMLIFQMTSDKDPLHELLLRV